MALWGFIQPVIETVSPAITWIPGIVLLPKAAIITLDLLVLYFGVTYVIGFLARTPGAIAGRIASTPERALTFSYWLQRNSRFFNLGKRVFRMLWGTIIDLSYKTEVLEQLEVATVPYLGGESDGYVTKVQKHFKHWECDPRTPSEEALCDAQLCSTKVFYDWRLWAFNPDWPIPAVGRPLRWYMQQCQHPLGISTRDAFQQYVSLGMTAPNISGDRPLHEGDLVAMIEAIKRNEPGMLVAGLLEPDDVEQEWVLNGTLDPHWRE